VVRSQLSVVCSSRRLTTDNGPRTTDKIGMYEHLLIKEETGILKITLNRPDKLNAFIGHMRRDLAEALEAAGSDRGVRVVVITGAGRAFCAGGDVNFMAELMERHDSEEFARILGSGRRVITSIRQMSKPVIAAVNGVASGAGCNLALACDLRIASTNATFSQSFLKVGLHPDWGGTYFLPRLLTPNKVCELFFLGEAIDASEAARLSLVNQVVAPEDLEAATQQLAERLRAAPPIALAAAKQAVYASQAADLDEMLRYETDAQLRCFESDDGREGVRAFIEKREPRFTGY
jgi:enoyl-CoA hydratase/carnithine racemase